jgi:crotonobetainyl-CoA:carnitine CoA-transferase CaiB-like acyl-CoA transferase
MAEMLAGLKVLDLSMWQPGHVATQLLADLGGRLAAINAALARPARWR